MYHLCDDTYSKLRDTIWNVGAEDWHEKAEFYSQGLLKCLDDLQPFMYGTEFVLKKYSSLKWVKPSRPKQIVEQSWMDKFSTSVWTGQSFFGWIYQDFFYLHQDMQKREFKSNRVFPDKVCFSRKYIRRVRYLKTSLKRILYMMIYGQIPLHYECKDLVEEAIVGVSVYLEVVLAIYALQQSESRSLDYRTASWKWKCVAELSIPDARQAQNLAGPRWGT
jgi:hypothetical protein